VILDLCSKAVVGWAADTHMRTGLVLDAFSMAITARSPAPGLIVHSDRETNSRLRTGSTRWPLSTPRRRWDASGGVLGQRPAESWFGGFKNELVHPIGAFATRHEAQVEIARYIPAGTTPRVVTWR
jgi:putative transposase